MSTDSASSPTAIVTVRTPAPWWRRAETVAAVAAIVSFANALPNDFCFDDTLIVRDNPRVNAPGQWLNVWTTDHWSATPDAASGRDLLFRPVSLSSYRLVRVAGGGKALPQHMVNVLLHALIAALIVRLCRHLGGSGSAPLVSGVLFAVLPIHTEAVAAVVGRADLLAVLGILLALLAHRRSMLSAGRKYVWRWCVGAGLAAFVAMGSKESGVAVVVLVVLADAYWHRDRHKGGRGPRWWNRDTLARLAYLLIPLVVYFSLRYHALGGRLYQQTPATKTINVLVDAPSWQHALGVIQLWGMYWAKTLWPEVLSVKYTINSIRLAIGPLDPHVLLGVAAIAGLLAGSVAAWRRGTRSVALLSSALVLSYLPTANALVLMQVFFAERIWYLPSVWITVLAGMAAARWMHRPGAWVTLAVLVLGMTARCWLRTADWRNNETLFAAAYRDQPEAAGPLHLYGQWLTRHGQYEPGVELLQRAIDIDLGFTDAHRALGRAHLEAGLLEAAVRYLQIAQSQAPGHRPTEAALERASARLLAEHDEELQAMRQTAFDNPGDVRAEIALVRRLRELGRVGEALARFREHEHESAFAGHAAWQAEYAVTLVYGSKRDQAIERYRECLRLDPNDPQVAVELAMLLLERREGDDLDRAWEWAMRASKLAPDASPVLACRAELLALRDNLGEALELYERAIRALPPNSAQRRAFEQRATALGRRP